MGEPNPGREDKDMHAAVAPPADDLDVAANRGDWVKMGTQVRETTRRRLRRLAGDQDLEQRDVIDAALHAYLKERGY